jgi:DHA3 family tetracycline resistance protein-like MFS transporter
VQKHVPADVMGRVLSIDYFGGGLLLPIAPIAFAALIAAVGPSSAFVIGGVFAAIIAGALLLVPSIRALD